MKKHVRQAFRKKHGLMAPLVLGVSAALALSGCGSSAGGADNDSEASTLNFGLSGDVPTMTAGLNQGSLGIFINSVIHRGLLAYNNEGEIVPALAAEYEMVDPKTWSFTLHEDLTFHDGSALTSEEVKTSLEYLMLPETNASGLVAFEHIESIETPSELEVIIHLDANNVAFEDYLADPNHAIFPESALNQDTDNLVGAGPFELVQKNEGVSLELEKFDGYYDADDVALDEVMLSAFPDGTARVNALQSGELDVIDYVPWESFDLVESNDDLVLDSTEGPVQEIIFNTESGPLADPQVREAIAYAIDREAMVDTVFEGRAEPMYGVIVQEGSEFDIPEATQMYEYDPEHAKELLAEAGYPDGFDITITANSTYSFVQDTGLSVQQSLKDIGINASMDTPDWPSFIEATNTGNYEIGISGGVGYVGGPEYLSTFVSGPGNLIRSYDYENADLDEALRRGAEADNDSDRVEAFTEVFDIISKDTPVIFPAQRAQAYGYHSDVEGFQNLPGFLTLFSGYTLAETSVN